MISPGLGESRDRILRCLKRDGTATIPELAAEIELSVETVRAHLRGLAAQSLVERRGSRRQGRGRPEFLHGLTEAAEALFPNRESKVLNALVQYMQNTGQDALLEAFFESETERRRTEARGRIAGLSGEARVREVARILDDEGFMATVEQDAEGMWLLRLGHCPLHNLVTLTQQPCRSELAFVRELLGSDTARISHIPDGASACTYSVGPQLVQM